MLLFLNTAFDLRTLRLSTRMLNLSLVCVLIRARDCKECFIIMSMIFGDFYSAGCVVDLK